MICCNIGYIGYLLASATRGLKEASAVTFETWIVKVIEFIIATEKYQ